MTYIKNISEFKAKASDRLFNSKVNYDKKNKLNKSNDILSLDFCESISNDGISIEQLDALTVPIFKYATQITIHGIFEMDADSLYLRGYKHLILNKNKSLGMRYNAIDCDKKYHLHYICRNLGSKFNCKIDSKECTFSYYSTDLDKISKLFEQKLPIIGNKYVYVVPAMFGGGFLLSISLNAVYQKDLYSFVSFLTDGKITNENDYNTAKKENDRLETIEREKMDKEYNESVERRKQEQINKLKDVKGIETLPTDKEYILYICTDTYSKKYLFVFTDKKGAKKFCICYASDFCFSNFSEAMEKAKRKKKNVYNINDLVFKPSETKKYILITDMDAMIE